MDGYLYFLVSIAPQAISDDNKDDDASPDNSEIQSTVCLEALIFAAVKLDAAGDDRKNGREKSENSCENRKISIY